MHLPRRSVKSIQPLPSIYTAFPVNNEDNNSSEHSGKCLIRHIEDGIEVVPLEMSNVLSAPILSPDQAEKELFIISQEGTSPSDKPLPRLPKTLWARLSIKQRILALVGVQLALLLTIGLSLLAAKQRVSSSDLSVRTESTNDTLSTAQDMGPIPRGPFAVPIQLPQQQSSACLSRTNESVAWQCASDTTFQLNILPSPMHSNMTMITLGSAPATNGTLYHGHQAPNVSPTELRAVSTSSDSDPVYHFRTSYDRIVLLKQSDLTPSDKPRAQPAMRHPTFEQGETLWRCVWNQTMIEGYIYPKQRATTNNMSNSTAPAMVQELPKMPHVLKIVEQRVPNGRQPYCEKVRVGEAGLVGTSSGERVVLSVAETGTEAVAKALSRKVRGNVRDRRQVVDSGGSANCRCQWMVQ